MPTPTTLTKLTRFLRTREEVDQAARKAALRGTRRQAANRRLDRVWEELDVEKSQEEVRNLVDMAQGSS